MDRGTVAQLAAAGTQLDVARLSAAARIDALVALQQLQAWADAQSVRVLAAMDVGSQLDRDLAATEVGVALREPPAIVHGSLQAAHELVDRLPATLALLQTGQVTYRHVRVLADAIVPLTDEVAAKVQRDVLDRAPTQTVANFRRCVHRAVLRHDRRTIEKRREDLLAQRRVCGRDVGDGMGELWASLPLDGLAAIMARLDAEAMRKLPGDDRTADQRRADALVALAEQGLLDKAVPAQHGRQPTIQVTVNATTLLGLDDDPGELDGYGPIPASVARAVAADPTGRWRRLLLDDQNHLIDYAQQQYRPCRVLQEFVIARDRTCRFPGCTRKARCCDLDHVVPWPDGPTSAGNCECLCEHHHRLKHEGGWTVIGNPNGTLTWISPTGHKYESPPGDYG